MSEEGGETIVCCEWCGENKKPEQMATEFLCDECIHVADLDDGEPA